MFRVTKEVRQEFRKTAYAKKNRKPIIGCFVVLIISCIITGFLLGYQESGQKELFEYQNYVVFVSIILSFCMMEQIGKYEGALEYYASSKKGKKK